MTDGLDIGVWCLLIIASITDISRGKVYNWLTLPFFLTGIIYQIYLSGIPSFQNLLLSFATASLIFFPLYLAKIVAAGDVKLVMAASTWLSFEFLWKLSALSIVVGALVGFLIAILKNGVLKSFSNLIDHLKVGVQRKSTRVPFAPAFLCAFSILKIAEARGW